MIRYRFDYKRKRLQVSLQRRNPPIRINTQKYFYEYAFVQYFKCFSYCVHLLLTPAACNFHGVCRLHISFSSLFSYQCGIIDHLMSRGERVHNITIMAVYSRLKLSFNFISLISIRAKFYLRRKVMQFPI